MQSKARKIVCALIVLQFAVSLVQAGAMDDLNKTLRTIAAALALLMFTIQGLRWVMSDSVADRAEAKKGMVYVMMGLLVVYLAAHIVCGLYGSVLSNYNQHCDFDDIQFTCKCCERPDPEPPGFTCPSTIP